MPDRTKRWKLKPQANDQVVRGLVHPRCPEVAARLLAQRGIADPETASIFFRPKLDQLHDPFLMADMLAAVERIEQALGENERIMVYGDYDVDGTTAVALVYSFLTRFTGNITFYIPDRYSEGYGISFQGIEHAKEDGVKLIIALDCGIKAIDKVARANEFGIDMIICDHHRPGETLPAAVAVLDPKRDDCPYPFKELSGCGIGFKLVQGIAQRNGVDPIELEPLLDLVAVSTACDIVPVDGENRVLTHFGLKRVNNNPRPGIKAMLQMANVKRTLGVTELVFTVGPRINAAGRIEHGRQAVELLLAKDQAQADAMGVRVDGNNVARQELDRETTRAALELFTIDPALRDSWSTVVFNEEWHKGVIGIVASRLIEQFYRPTIVLTESQGKAVGSARSVRGFDVYEAINACSDLLDQFGGHMYAAGLTMPLENIPAFRDRFEAVVRKTLPPALRVPEEEVDAEITFSDINDPLARILHHMAPFGPGNMKPVFLTRGVVDTGSARIVGDDHLKMSLRMAGGDGRVLDAIGFRLGAHLEAVKSGEPFSVLYNLEENEWNGRTTLQLNIKDLKPGTKVLETGSRIAETASTR
ncbi:MAG: single-stranded-DNA-specific exonuclease RecJ [Flavobacteriales bacterium]|nr:single-stranded-DNA-specific exonuclease RecJ [Flavobacteriales bacterium]MBK7102598.1 single-stranded-DNA-specific exonuclease RecJ [Flavobacteriales bacterium]MBK7482665.1 single-stranded-DNA-specific exonuclease RecJ [Flavobacteriales bacterium]MBK8530696.1 single-stranded-DNA-specific exonuclease RecJ [Flavobacteriales bacterium]MBK8709889.1 single-stranded-DNA-specific exonuclease RecJ [Flavobacteriales bacterium]